MRKVLQQLLFVASISFIGLSCEKGEEPFPPVRPAEKTLIKLPEGGNLVSVALDISTSMITVNVLEIRRDATSPADLNRTQVVKIAKSNSILSDFSGATVSELGRNYYETHPDNPFDGQYWTVTFQPGEFVKFLKLNLVTLNLTSLGRVGLGFQLAEAPNAQISDAQSQVAAEISAKNQWDGVYRINYRLVHPNTAIGGSGVVAAWEFPSSGPTSIDWDFATVFNNFTTGGLTYFGDAAGPSLQVRIIVNPANNSVTFANIGSRAAALGFPPLVALAPDNRYDPVAKKFYVAYGWAGTPNREKYDTLTYIRPR